MDVLNQICSLEQAKNLLELGINKSATFYWVDRGEHSRVVYSGQIEFIEALPIIPAYTVAELGEMLPTEYLHVSKIVSRLKSRNSVDYVTVWKNSNNEWGVRFIEKTKAVKFHSEAQARAAMLIYLLKNNLLQAA